MAAKEEQFSVTKNFGLGSLQGIAEKEPLA
jgi:hypothetical protein